MLIYSKTSRFNPHVNFSISRVQKHSSKPHSPSTTRNPSQRTLQSSSLQLIIQIKTTKPTSANTTELLQINTTHPNLLKTEPHPLNISKTHHRKHHKTPLYDCYKPKLQTSIYLKTRPHSLTISKNHLTYIKKKKKTHLKNITHPNPLFIPPQLSLCKTQMGNKRKH